MGPRQSLAETPGDDSGFTVVVDTPSPQFLLRPDGTTSIHIEGFATPERRPGAPDVPTRTLLIAIPDGTVPRLEVRSGPERILPGVVPRPVPRSVPRLVDGTAAGADDRSRFIRAGDQQYAEPRPVERDELDLPDARYYEADRPFPERLAWLGKVGTLRRQRYVELHVAPVRFHPVERSLGVHDRVTLTVHFDGGRPASAGAVGDVGEEEGPFERVYRGAFENYEQGKRFRLTGEQGAVYPVPSAEEPRGAPTPRQRVLVHDEGVVRLDHTRLSGTEFLTHAISTWRLTNRGVDVPLRVHDDGDDLLEAGEWVEFYGQALDDEPKTELNTDIPGTDDDLFEARDFTDVNTYFLTVDGAPPAMAERDATPAFALTPPTDFEAVSHVEVDNLFVPLGAADPWYWQPVLSAGGATSSTTVDVPLPGLAAGTADARVRVQLRGFTNFTGSNSLVDQTHLPRASLLNGTSQVLAFDDGSFQGRSVYLHDFEWTYPGSGPQLSDPAKVKLEVFTVPGVSINEAIADWYEVAYRRSFTAIGELLTFDWPDQNAEFVVDGLSDTSAEIFEVTRGPGQSVVQAVRLTGASFSCSGSCSVRFRIDDRGSGEDRRFVVFGDGVPLVPGDADFSADTVSDLRSNAIQADLVVLAHEELLDDAPGSPLDLLLAHRATPQGGGLTSKIVRLADVYDEFNFGMPGPLAIKEFLRWISSSAPGEGWADPKPTHLLLIGDASVNYKGGTAVGNYVPTQVMFKDVLELGYYASDAVMADFVGDDQLADILIGRFPARSSAEADVMLQKTLDYEQSAPAGSWREHALFVSDRGKTGNNPAEALEFELTNSIGAGYIPSPYTSQQLRYWSDYYDNPTYLNDPNQPAPKEGIRRDIKAALNGPDCASDGAALTQFNGHGNAQVWSDDAFWDERFPPTDADDLCNAARPTWLLAMNCLTGAFHVGAVRTLGEDWIKRDGGGAVAVLSPSGLSFNYIGRTVTNIVWGDLFGPRKERDAGVTVMNTYVQLCANGSIEACQNLVYMGDPALQLALRAVAPATDVVAVAGNAVVDLDWTASTTPGATYNVWRTGSLEFPSYTKRNGSPIAGTSYADTGVSNTHTYYYYVVAVDSGFESRLSNFNSDCASDGPDCVKATPLNPGPPSVPGSVTLSDPGQGDRLVVSWDPAPENDLAYYTVKWGTESMNYVSSATAQVDTSFTLSGLVEGQVYYVAVSATNTSNHTSADSAEASDFPVFAIGLRAPRYIADLTVSPSGDDIRLDWSEVDTDIFGKPKAVAKYEIYRGVTPGFDNGSLGAPIDECFSPCSSYLDPGARTAPDSYRYRVRAVDAEGTRGGLGAEPPQPTTLAIHKVELAPGELALSWTPVLTRVDGGPANLLHYEIYAADQPFSRADIRDGNVPLLAIEPGTLLQIAPPGQSRYYSVLAVDRLGNRSQF